MKFKLKETVTDTKFNIASKTYSEFQSIISSYFLYQKEYSGMGAVCRAFVIIYNRRFNRDINPDDYIVHHKNGLHSGEDYQNLVLIHKDINHLDFHREVKYATIYEYASQNGYKSGEQIPPELFKNISMKEKYKILNMYIDLCVKKLYRKAQSSNDEKIIFCEDIINKEAS